MAKVLFVLKKREDYNSFLHNEISTSTGLYNSAKYIEERLVSAGIDTKIVVVTDNNCIDKEVSLFEPTHVIIEALWVVPEKFTVLNKLHPDVKWVIRLHSDIPFIAIEQVALGWITDYVNIKNVYVAVNDERIRKDLVLLTEAPEKIVFLPNSYTKVGTKKKLDKKKDYIDIGCFGAVRPLKNHLEQAFAALEFAESLGKQLRFHINSGRNEQRGEAVFENLVNMFAAVHDRGHRLILHPWCSRKEFLEICSSMDIGMQVSFSETFNIVAADMLSCGVPIVTSREIPWASRIFAAAPTEQDRIYNALVLAYTFVRSNVWENQRRLNKYSELSTATWLKYLEDK